jgi:DNA-directed RNA polymerase subunit E"
MAVQKACKQCKTIFEGNECPNCHSHESSDSIKGKIFINNPEQSELAKNLNIKQKGSYAIKIG